MEHAPQYLGLGAAAQGELRFLHAAGNLLIRLSVDTQLIPVARTTHHPLTCARKQAGSPAQARLRVGVRVAVRGRGPTGV